MPTLNTIFNQEEFWGSILSEDKLKITRILNSIDSAEIRLVINHLEKMNTEDGWHPAQKKSAAFALDIIHNIFNL